MGFDNECILNIQSLAGEYFCPVCRLLVYPNEALQSQCTHLYCKPCLTYIVSTTQACPYDGYLVTEADSKPLIESNKVLAETIGKIIVHCLYHRSGCSWQGPLSECTSHCSGCAFGNSPVVCNRCGIQIVHRQVQDHAQNCPGVQPQAQPTEGVQDASATGTPATGDQNQAATQAGATASQVQTQTTATPPTGKDPGQQANSNSQAQAIVQAAVPTAEQWYQQQQQYQQYYQQYPGYNPYQQQYPQYYPYQQQAIPQYQQQQQHLQAQPQGYIQPQPQPQPQLQPQMQSQPQVQPQAQPQPQLQPSQPPSQVGQPQNQSQVNTQQQTHPLPHSQPLPQPQPQPQSYPHVHTPAYPQAQPHPQPHPIQPHPQQMQIPQYQQPLTQMQHAQPQIQHPIAQPQPQPQQQTQVQPHPQSHTHPQVNPPLPNQTQIQHTAAHAVTGHHSYPQPPPQPHQQMPLGGPPQHPMLVHPHSGVHPQMQNQFSQQTPQMRPPQSHATIPNQQQTTLLPSPVQVSNIPPAQQPPTHPHAHQPGVPVPQRPVMQPMQQPVHQLYGQQQQPFAGQYQQVPFAQQQPPLQSQLRPQGPPHSFQQHSHSYPQPQQNVALLHGMQPHQPQNLVGRPMTPNHGVQPQPYQQSAIAQQGRAIQYGSNQPLSNQSNMLGTNNQMQLSSEQQSVVASKPAMSEKQDIAETSVDKKEVEPSFQKTTKNDGNKLDATSGPRADAVVIKMPKSETDVKLMDDEIKTEVEDKTNPVDTSAKEFATGMESDALENAEPVIKQMVKEEVIENVEDHKDSANINGKQVGLPVLEDKEIRDGPLQKTPQLQEAAQLGEQSGKLQKGKILAQAQGFPQGPALVPPAGQVQPGSSVQSPSMHYRSSTLQQRPAAPSMFQAPHPGALHHTQAVGNHPTQFRPQGSSNVPHPGTSTIPPENFQPSLLKPHGPEIPSVGIPGSGSAAPFARGPGYHGPPQHSFEPLTAPHGPYNQGHMAPSHAGPPRISQGDPVGGLPVCSVPPSAFDTHGGMMARPPYGPEGLVGKQHPNNLMEAEIFPSQRLGYLDGRRPDSHLPGSLDRSPLGQPSGIQSNMMRMNGAPGLELQDERFKPFPEDRLNPYPVDRGEFEEDLKQFPRPSHLENEPGSKLGNRFPSSRPLDRGPHGFGMDVGPRPYDKGLNYDPGLKLDPVVGSAASRFLPSYVGERPVGFHDDAPARSDSARAHPEFLGPGSGYRRRHMDGLSPRSPVREYPGISSHAFGGLPGNLGSSHSGLDDIDGREFRRFGDPMGNSFHESRFPVFPGHLRRGEFEGPGRSGDLIGQDFLPNHLRRGEHLGPHNLRLGETVGFGGFPGHGRMGDLGGPGNFPPRLGEPGFRSSFSHQGYTNDGGFYTDDMESFENSRKRKPPSMGWCRICKFDCETVDGLDLHSQTREHQKMAMDMVVTIKQNAKKQKLTSGDRAIHDDGNKSRNATLEDRGKKH